jgi:hypothetical protein
VVAVAFDEYAPFDSGAGANVTEDTWRKMMKFAGSPSGVLRGQDSALAVFGDSSGMQVKVPTGQVWIEGHWGRVTSQKTVAITAAHASNARKDRIVARADFVNNKIELDVLTGTPAGSPTLPSLTQSSSIWEISLAEVAVAAAATTITSGNVTDRRTFDCAVARYRKSSTQSISNDTLTKVTFPTVVTFSGDITPNTALDEFTLNRGGWWHIGCGLSWATGTTGFRRAEIATSTGSASYAKNRVGAAGDSIQLNTHTAVQLAAGAIISVYARHTQGSSLNLDAIDEGTWVSFTWVAY